MLKNHRIVLLRNRVDLVRDLEPNEVINYLYQESVLSENDTELIKAEKTRKARAELLLDTLPRKGPKAFLQFKRSLERENGMMHLAELLVEPSMGRDVVDSAMRGPEKHGKTERITDGSSECYKMNHKPHGLCLIINNKEFLNNLSDRIGSDIDAKNLQQLFSSMNFTTRVVNNATADHMKEVVEEIASMDHSLTDCLVVCLLSHGISGKIYGSDGELLPVSELLRPLLTCEDKPELANKPRLFFIQACRVNSIATGLSRDVRVQEKKVNSYEVIVHSEGEVDSTQDSLSCEEALTDASDLFIQETATPLQANILMSYSTLPGEAAWRNLETGSWFIDALVEVFNKYASAEDILSMLVRVNNAVSKRVSSITQTRQIPAPVVTLTKKLYLNCN